MYKVSVLWGISGNDRKRRYNFFLAAVQLPEVTGMLLVRTAKRPLGCIPIEALLRIGRCSEEGSLAARGCYLHCI